MVASWDVTRRVVFPASGVVELEEIRVPPLGSRDIRVRTAVSLISSGTECATLLGPPWKHPDGREMPSYPCPPGYSHTGTITAVGDQVTVWNVGDRVASAANHIGLTTLPPGAPRQRIPDDVSFEEATFTTLSATVLNGVRIGAPALGEVAVVIGLGILGQLAVRYLSVSGVAEVIGIDLDSFRLDRAGDALTAAVNPRETDPLEAVRRLSGGRGADVVYEVTGLTPTFNLAFDLVRKHGRVVALGSPRWPAEVDMMTLHLKAIRLFGAIVSSHPNDPDGENRWVREANAEFFLRLLSEGRIEVGSLVTHRFPASQAAEAFALLTEKREPALGVLLDWSDEGSAAA